MRELKRPILLIESRKLIKNVFFNQISSRTEIDLSRKLVARVVRLRIEVAVTIRPFAIFYDAAGRLKTTVKIKYLRTNNALPIGQA